MNNTFNNAQCSTFSLENLKRAQEIMRGFIENESEELNLQPQCFLFPPVIRCKESKYWVPYGDTAVLVNEEIEYKYIRRIRGYLRDKRQNVSMPRFIKAG